MAVTRHIEQHRIGYRSLELIILSLVLAFLIVVFVYGVYRVVTGDIAHCAARTSAGSGTGLVLAAVTFVGFVVGRAAGYFRKLIHNAPGVIVAGQSRRNRLIQVCLTVFLTGGVFLLGYETFAVYHNGNPPPITTYVRCAAADNLTISALVAAFISLLLGNWLWYPTRESLR